VSNRFLKRTGRAGVALAVGCAFAAVPVAAQAAPARVDLRTADPFSVLAYSTVTNASKPTIMSGGLGLHPLASVTGEPVVLGETHLADAVALQAKNDLDTAYVDAAGRAFTPLASAELSGRRLTSGVYRSPTMLLSAGELELDAQGDPNAVFIFQVGSDFTMMAGTAVSLLNGAQACNVYWQVGNIGTLGTNSSFVGTLMAYAKVDALTDARIQGRLMSQTEAVNLQRNVITTTACAAGTTGGSPVGGGDGTGGTGGTAPGTTPAAGTPAAQNPPGSRSATPTRNGTARLLRPPARSSRRPPTSGGTPCTEGFQATVRGKLIKRVVFSLDGKRIGTRTKPKFRVYVRADGGLHGIKARVTFKDATRAKTMRFRYRACAAQVLQPRRGPSQFTG